MTDLNDLSAAEIVRRVRVREVKAAEVVEAALARIAATEPTANAFIHVDSAGARAAAAEIDRRVAAGEDPGSLAGVPVSVKDLVHVEGMPTTFGSRAFQGTAAPGDAIPVARLRDAGAVLVGKTTTPEFGHKAITASPLFGETRNPWNRAFTSGGSSGGAAASIAWRQVPLAVGTDGGGSVRIPASACGIFGLKATLGRIPHAHAPDLFANNACIGPMAGTLDDLRLMYGVMAGETPEDPWSQVLADPAPAPGRPRIGWALKIGNPVVEPDVAAATEVAVAALAGVGMDPEPVEIDLASSEPQFRVMLETALAARAGKLIESQPELFDPTFVTTVRNGLTRTGAEVQAAAADRSALYRRVERLFEGIDYLLTPTLAATSVPAETDTHADIIIANTNAGRIRAGWYPYTFPFNLTGHPALSLPTGRDGNGLPTGLQIVGRWYDEAGILALAQSLASLIDVGGRRPAPERKTHSSAGVGQ